MGLDMSDLDTMLRYPTLNIICDGCNFYLLCQKHFIALADYSEQEYIQRLLSYNIRRVLFFGSVMYSVEGEYTLYPAVSFALRSQGHKVPCLVDRRG